MVTQNAQSVANSIMAEAIENWLGHEGSGFGTQGSVYLKQDYQPEELVARGQIFPIAEEI